MGRVDIHKMNPTRDGFNPNPTRLATGWVDIHKMNPTRDGFNPNPTRLGTGWVDIHKMNPTQPITRVGLKIPTRPDPCAPLLMIFLFSLGLLRNILNTYRGFANDYAKQNST